MTAKKKAGRQTAKPEQSQAAPEGSQVLDLKGAAAFLKVSKPTFYRWLARGKIKGAKAGTQWRFYREDLERFLQAEEPSALQVDAQALRKAVQEARKARGLASVTWPETETPEESAVIGAVNTTIADALTARASDIHMDVQSDGILVRYRIDGVLHPVASLPRQASAPLVARLKLMAEMDISERRLPQHGRISVKHRGKDYDLRVTTVPALFGESAIMRILDQSSVLIGMDGLGFSKPMQGAFETVLHSPIGLVIAAGPAGCGKTTTLYSALHYVSSPERKIVTIEDPVEYCIPNSTQVQVNRKAGLTTAAALRAFVRADPDIILVAELRDLETAESCVQAALTGHLVLTTMLPGDAPSVITRLIDMRVESFLISASLAAVLAQRLVRRVCQKCKAEHKPSRELVLRLQAQTGLDLSAAAFQRGKGCAECRGTGYRGRTGIFELMEIDEKLRELIARPASTSELRQAAIEAGMTTMLKDGIEKAAAGVTTIEEVLRVLAVQQNP